MPLVSRKTLKFWEISAAIALLISLGIFISDFIFDFDIHMHHKLEIVELMVAGIFIGEVVVHLIHTDQKILYLKKNWIYILTILPLIGMMRVFKFGKAGKFIKFFELIAHSKIIKGEAMGVKLMGFFTPGALLLTKEAASMAYHLRRTDFRKVPKNLNIFYMYRYVSPKADPETAKGICQGLKAYMQKRKKKLVFIDVKWTQIEMQERHSLVKGRVDPLTFQSFLKKDSLVITDRPLNTEGKEGMFSGYAGLFSTSRLNHVHDDYSHLDPAAFRRMRGYILGFNTFARHNAPCYHNTDCAHKRLSLKDLDIYSFRYFMHQHLPLCEYHDA